MGAHLLLSVPITPGEKIYDGRRRTTDDDERRTTTNDGRRRRRPRRMTDDDELRWTTHDGRRTTDFFDLLYKNHVKSSTMCFFWILLLPGRRRLLTPGMGMGEGGGQYGPIFVPSNTQYNMFICFSNDLLMFVFDSVFIIITESHQTCVFP